MGLEHEFMMKVYHSKGGIDGYPPKKRKKRNIKKQRKDS